MVPRKAKWDKKIEVWSLRYKKNYFIWYPNGKIKTKIIEVKPKGMEKAVYYYSSGNFKKIGQNMYINDYGPSGRQIGYLSYGKWKEFYEIGKIKKEYCLTVEKDDLYPYLSFKCGIELIYDKNGKVTKIDHKRKCTYGCEELAYEEPVLPK